jgi:nucleoside-diphosphate-sugar epimerase
LLEAVAMELARTIMAAAPLTNRWHKEVLRKLTAGPAVSTADLLRRLARACGRKPLLFDVPEQVMRVAAQLTGRTQDIARLCGSLVVDDSATRAALGWNPPVPFDDGILRTARWCMESAKHAKR